MLSTICLGKISETLLGLLSLEIYHIKPSSHTFEFRQEIKEALPSNEADNGDRKDHNKTPSTTTKKQQHISPCWALSFQNRIRSTSTDSPHE